MSTSKTKALLISILSAILIVVAGVFAVLEAINGNIPVWLGVVLAVVVVALLVVDTVLTTKAMKAADTEEAAVEAQATPEDGVAVESVSPHYEKTVAPAKVEERQQETENQLPLPDQQASEEKQAPKPKAKPKAKGTTATTTKPKTKTSETAPKKPAAKKKSTTTKKTTTTTAGKKNAKK